jgi:hypothetical protein
MMAKVVTDIESLQTIAATYYGAAAAAQNSAVGILSKLPHRYKEIREGDHYKSLKSSNNAHKSNSKSHQKDVSVNKVARFGRSLFGGSVSGASVASTHSADNLTKYGALFNNSNISGRGPADRLLRKSSIIMVHQAAQDLEASIAGTAPCPGTGTGTGTGSGSGKTSIGVDLDSMGHFAAPSKDKPTPTTAPSLHAMILPHIGEHGHGHGEQTVPSSHDCYDGATGVVGDRSRRSSTIVSTGRVSLSLSVPLPEARVLLEEQQ